MKSDTVRLCRGGIAYLCAGISLNYLHLPSPQKEVIVSEYTKSMASVQNCDFCFNLCNGNQSCEASARKDFLLYNVEALCDQEEVRFSG
ncbi:hypothetical protein GDO81_026054 [Engystomops pustulosus]|uniref:Apple domain-containing protein n=1 Tax=Engystomops pustulosus TaxID=76066 RepID=A0AAV6YHL5_ENGPU|nr:hypothetical protein GDO81_026054 [Engystomops pustulosus]